MRAILCSDWGEPETLTLGDAPSPVAGPDEVTVRVRAAGVNFADIVLVRGQYQEKPSLPFSPGLEAAGEVLTVGEGVTGISPGDRVMAVLGVGAFAEEAVAPVDGVFAIPEGMDYTTAAAFPVAYGTSHLALTERAAMKAGETLLVLGAGGGVGLTAVECGKALGATVIAAASTQEKLDLAQAHGADHLINYVDEDLRASARKLTNGRGVDVVYDPVGGDASKAALRSLAPSGRLLVIGFAAGDVPQIAANYLLVKNISVVGVYWGWYRLNEPEMFRASFDELAKWYAEGRLKPHISQVFPLARAADALAVLESRKATGRLVIDIDG
ncbi:MAG: NADPH:quinone oxidoreductase family protein [Alphaproteobacteria bacterium]|nr:NADPH:quinone oxidoreductase family protein [Alphaproteobacteria bacterium]